MLAMAEIHYIKHLREKEGKSIQSIAENLSINWRTAKKYADGEDFNRSVPTRRHRSRPVIGPYQSVIDSWLLEDQKLPQKQRHTAKRIYDRLVESHGFKGVERTVRHYVSRRRGELGERKETYIQLAHPKGEAQADFGRFSAFHCGCLTEFQYLVVSFPYSNAGFVQVTPGENSECLLEGLKWIFSHIGSVPKKIRFDNLTAAVTKVLGGGDRVVTETFERFCLHYGFTASFCNVGRGNEKGHVENKVGYSRRNWLVPIPTISDIESFNRELFDKAFTDHKRLHYQNGEPIQHLFDAEREAFGQLPTVGFEVCRLTTAVVDKYCRVKLDDHYYHGIDADAGSRLRLKVSWNTVTVLGADNEPMAQYQRLYHTHQTAVNWQYQFRALWHKPRAVRDSVYFQLLPQAIQHYLCIDDRSDIKQRLSMLSRLTETHELSAIAKAIAEAAQIGRSDEETIRHQLYRQTASQRGAPLLETYTPKCLAGYRPDLTRYNQLTVTLDNQRRADV